MADESGVLTETMVGASTKNLSNRIPDAAVAVAPPPIPPMPTWPAPGSPGKADEPLTVEQACETSSGAGRSVARSNATGSPALRVVTENRTRVRPRSSAKLAPPSCQWCRQPLGPRNRSGRTRVYCSQSCRQRAYQSRKRSKQLGLKDGELLVSSVLLARMNRRLQALEAALREVEMTGVQNVDYRIARLCEAAGRLRRMVVGPPTR